MSNRDLVVIGGSAGAVEPLKTILANLPADLPAAVVVVLHVPAMSTGIHATVAAHAGPLPVETASDGAELQHGQVYIAPPNHHLLISDGHLMLGDGPRENMVRPSIDPLFRSAAAVFGPRTIGVVLSGMLNDGASGLQAIKRCGGIALVQAPHDARARDMPLAALEATSVDLSAEAAHLAQAIRRHVTEAAPPPGPVPDDIELEIEIAAGQQSGSRVTSKIAKPVTLTCPDCGGTLSEVNGRRPLRYRCQVGHAYTSKTLLNKQEAQVDEAMRIALRIIEERAELVARMGRDATELGRTSTAEMYARRAAEYRSQAEAIRNAVFRTLRSRSELQSDNPLPELEVLGPE
jgi:two-component system chemotaxis response regulator CheB